MKIRRHKASKQLTPITLSLCLFIGSAFASQNPGQGSLGHNLCDLHIRYNEIRYNIPKNLMKAVSRVESGRVLPGQGLVAWPWTINANGTPYILETKAEAIAKVRQLRAKGIQSIDVGCMQVNLRHHPDAFLNLEDAFDPGKNVEYAARFLTKKRLAQGSWHEAVAHYHSATKTINREYKLKVLKHWTKMGSSADGYQTFVLNTPKGTNGAPKVVNANFFSQSGRNHPVRVKFTPLGGGVSTINREKANGKMISYSSLSRGLRQRNSNSHIPNNKTNRSGSLFSIAHKAPLRSNGYTKIQSKANKVAVMPLKYVATGSQPYQTPTNPKTTPINGASIG